MLEIKIINLRSFNNSVTTIKEKFTYYESAILFFFSFKIHLVATKLQSIDQLFNSFVTILSIIYTNHLLTMNNLFRKLIIFIFSVLKWHYKLLLSFLCETFFWDHLKTLL